MDSRNFQPLRAQWPSLYQYAALAEQYAYTDPATAAVKLRCFAESLVGHVYRELRLPSEPTDTFFDKLKCERFEEAVGQPVLQKLHALRIWGNKAAHGSSIEPPTSVLLIEQAFLLGQWMCKTYGLSQFEPYPAFTPPTQPASPTSNQSAYSTTLASRLVEAKEELQRVEASVKAEQAQTNELGQPVDDTKFLNFKHASAQATESIEFRPDGIQKLLRLQDAFVEYSLTEGQIELINKLEDFLGSNTESIFLLKGYAGTGKTFITKGLTEYFRVIGRNYVLAAPTGKASKVIASKTGSPAYTIHKTIYSFKDIVEYKEDDLDGTETFKFYAQVAVNDNSVDTVYIVDEASMVSDVYQEAEFFRFGTGYLLTDFLKFVNLDHNDHRKKVIFIGDNAQLPPVGMSFSPALNPDYLHQKHGVRSTSFELTEVVRQKSESGVIANAIPLRISLKERTFNKITIDFHYPDVQKVEHADLMARYLESCGGKINGEAIVIAHSNSDVGDYNRRIREHFFPGCPEVQPGDKVIAVSNNDSHGIFISNGDFGLIRRVLSNSEKRTITLKRKSNETGEVHETPVSLFFKDIIVGFKDLDGASHFFQAKIIENLLYSKEPMLSSDQNKALYIDFCQRHRHLKSDSVEFKHALKSDPYFNALRLKFGYAITCHKAQGSEWNSVFVKCKSHQSQLTADYFRWLYTAITRTAKKLYLLDPPDIRPWSGIKMVSTPVTDLLNSTKAENASPTAVSPPPPHKPEPSDLEEETFGIPASAQVLLALLKEVRNLIQGTGIVIEDVHHNQWQESYYFKRDAELTRVDISYTSKNKVGTVMVRSFDTLGSDLANLLSPLKGRPLMVGGTMDAEQVSFSKEFLNDFHEKVLELCGLSSITVQNVIEQQWSQRYSFVRDGAVAVFDVWYNGKDRFTKCQPVITACSPGPLVHEVAELLTKGMQG